MKQKSGMAHLIILLGITLICVILFIFFFVSKKSITNNFPERKLQSTSDTSKLRLNGDKIYLDSSLLFFNAATVSAVKITPDGKYHFQSKRDFPNFPLSCYDPTKIDNTTTLSKPADYAKLYSNCQSGYLANSSYFTYILIPPYGDAILNLEDKNNAQKTISFKRDVFETYLKNTPTTIITYLYPQNGSPAISNRLILTFAYTDSARNNGPTELLLLFDTTNNVLLDSVSMSSSMFPFPKYRFSPYGAPLAVVSGGWEGVSQYLFAVDFKSDKIKIIDLAKIDKPKYYFFDEKLRKINWSPDGFTFTTYDQIDASEKTKKIEDSLQATPNFPNDRVMITNFEKEAVQKLKSDSTNVDAYCLFGPGMYGGCYTAQNVRSYKYDFTQGNLILQ